MAERARVHLLVSGRVQGVAFRAYTVDEARRLGVAGWVRNLADGRVEAEAEGDRAALEALVRFCRRGPPAARVDDLEATWSAFGGDLGTCATRREGSPGRDPGRARCGRRSRLVWAPPSPPDPRRASPAGPGAPAGRPAARTRGPTTT